MSEPLIYNILLIAVFAFAVITFTTLLFITAPYGRHFRKGWGILIPSKWGWFIMEFPAFIIILLLFLLSSRTRNPVALIFILMWCTHYGQRTFIYPFLMKGRIKEFPIMLIAFALIFNSINGYLNGRYLFYFSPVYTIDWFFDIRFIAGFLIFAAGMFTNIHSDSILRNLRNEGKDGYMVPRRGMFKYVSSPNYFGEILEWIGWAIATWSLPGMAFALFTIGNLAPRALSNHKWYIENFSDYPENRKALIPFIY
jgi:3-oxo-5-alpha-steroid 4-dehydrogenase 1